LKDEERVKEGRREAKGRNNRGIKERKEGERRRKEGEEKRRKKEEKRRKEGEKGERRENEGRKEGEKREKGGPYLGRTLVTVNCSPNTAVNSLRSSMAAFRMEETVSANQPKREIRGR
jgi:hypothetical protein